MSEKTTRANQPEASKRTPRQFDVGDGLHVVTWNNGNAVAILSDYGRPFDNMPTMTTDEAEAAVRRAVAIHEELRANLLRRIAIIRKRRRDAEWSISRDQLRELIDQFGIEKAGLIVYNSMRYFGATLAEIGAPVPHMERVDEDEALQRLIRQQFETESEVE